MARVPKSKNKRQVVEGMALSGVQASTPQESQALVTRISPVLATGTSLKRANMLAGMKWLYAVTAEQVARLSGLGPIDAGDLRNYATTLAICIDKVELLEGRPTERVEGLAEFRHIFPQVAARLARVQATVVDAAPATPADSGQGSDTPTGGTPALPPAQSMPGPDLA